MKKVLLGARIRNRDFPQKKYLKQNKSVSLPCAHITLPGLGYELIFTYKVRVSP